jgi:RNA polymerase sigma-70 factor (ECF subfamily)
MSGSDRNIGEIALTAGQRDAGLDELFRRHGQWLRQVLGRSLRVQPADIEDIVQDTYLRVARQPAGTIDHPKAFLARTALNLFRDARRREAVRSAHRRATVAASVPMADPHGLAEQEAKVELTRLIAEMPEPFLDVFALSRFAHMTNADIATKLGLSVKTVEWRMGKALAFCMARLGD